MAFSYQGNIKGGYSPRVMEFTKASGTHLRPGMLVQKPNSTALVSQYTADTAVPILGIVDNSTLSTDTKVRVIMCGTGSIIQGDVKEISSGTSLAISSAVDGYFVITGLNAGSLGPLEGATIEVVNCAESATTWNNVVLTVESDSTDAVLITSACTTFSAGDTVKILTLTDSVLGAESLGIDETSGMSFTLTGTGAGSGDFFRALSVTEDGKRIIGVVTAGFDLTDALA